MVDPGDIEAGVFSLAEALRELRGASGVSGELLADRTGISQSKISKIENSKLIPSLTDVELIVAALDAEPEKARDLLSLARVANFEYRTDRQSQQRGWHNRQRELAAYEKVCTEFRYCLPTMITGLLQTPEYALRAVTDPVHRVPGSDKVERDVVARKMARQQVLYGEGKQFTFLLTESALRWRLVPPAFMAVQLDKVVSYSQLEAVSVDVVPTNIHVPGCSLNVFTVYDQRLVTTETYGGLVLLRDPQDIAYHLKLFKFFQQYALRGDQATEFVRGIADEFRREVT